MIKAALLSLARFSILFLASMILRSSPMIWTSVGVMMCLQVVLAVALLIRFRPGRCAVS